MIQRHIACSEGMMDLSRRLARCPEVNVHDRPDEPESAILAHAFWDLEDSFRKVLDVYLARLVHEDLDPPEIRRVLNSIGEEFRHILYHMRDPHYFRDFLDYDQADKS